MKRADNGGAKTRIVCIGLSDVWLAEWLARDDALLVGLVDLYDELDAWRREGQPVPPYWPGLQVYADVDEALDTLRPDAVTIVTPPDRKTSVELIAAIVNKGCDVLLQKLRPERRGDGERLLRLSERSGRAIVVGEGYHFDRHVEAAKQMIGQGVLGQVEQVVWQCYRPAVTANWMAAYGHVMLEDLTYHHLGAIHHLLDFQCRRIYAESYSCSWSAGLSREVVSMSAVSKQGVRLQYFASWSARGGETSWLGDFRIEGSEGALHYSRDRLVHFDRQGKEREAAPTEPYPYEFHQGVIHDFLAAGAVRRLSCGLAIARFLPVLRLVDAAIESAESGHAVTVE